MAKRKIEFSTDDAEEFVDDLDFDTNDKTIKTSKNGNVYITNYGKNNKKGKHQNLSIDLGGAYGYGFIIAAGISWFATNHDVLGTFWRALLSWAYIAYYIAKGFGKI
jgi:hypothetical protein